jgi:hypothetical protein
MRLQPDKDKNRLMVYDSCYPPYFWVDRQLAKEISKESLYKLLEDLGVEREENKKRIRDTVLNDKLFEKE